MNLAMENGEFTSDFTMENDDFTMDIFYQK